MMISLRSLWKLVTPFTVVVCVAFAAQASNNLIETAFLPDAARAPTQVTVATVPAAPVPVPSKDGAALVARNMFCHDCTAIEKSVDSEKSAEEGGLTTLPLRLIATQLAVPEEYSFASVLNTESQHQGGYRVGQSIPDAGEIREIGRTSLRFYNEKKGRMERLEFSESITKITPATRAASSGARAKPNSLAAEYVRVIDSTHYEVDRKLVEKLQGNPMLGGARARPVVRDGKMQGVRMYGVRSSGLAHAMGLRNGDTLVAANGVKLQSMEAGLELMGQLKSKDHWSINIERRGKPVSLSIDLQ